MNLVTPKARAKHEPFVQQTGHWSVEQKLMLSSSFRCDKNHNNYCCVSHHTLLSCLRCSTYLLQMSKSSTKNRTERIRHLWRKTAVFKLTQMSKNPGDIFNSHDICIRHITSNSHLMDYYLLKTE